jgi:hypothetical protein
MEEQTSRELAGEWRGLIGHRSAAPSHEHLVHAMGGLLPDELSAAAAVSGNDGPAIVAHDARRIFVLRPREADGETGIELQVNTLEVAQTTVAVTEQFVEAPRLTRRRCWSVSTRDTSIIFATEQALRTAFAFERNARKDELLARSIAAALGWVVPYSEDDR